MRAAAHTTGPSWWLRLELHQRPYAYQAYALLSELLNLKTWSGLITDITENAFAQRRRRGRSVAHDASRGTQVKNVRPAPAGATEFLPYQIPPLSPSLRARVDDVALCPQLTLWATDLPRLRRCMALYV